MELTLPDNFIPFPFGTPARPGVFLTDIRFWAANIESCLIWLRENNINYSHKGMVIVFEKDEDLTFFALRYSGLRLT